MHLPIFLNGKKIARKEMPSLARRLGLSFRPSSLRGRIGELNGILAGRRVLVRPDKPSILLEYRFPVEGLLISTARQRPEAGSAPMKARNPLFNRRFPSRTVPSALRERLAATVDFQDALLSLLKARKRVVALTLDSRQLMVQFKTGGWARRQAYLTAAEIEYWLPVLLEIVLQLEKTLTESPGFLRARRPALSK